MAGFLLVNLRQTLFSKICFPTDFIISRQTLLIIVTKLRQTPYRHYGHCHYD